MHIVDHHKKGEHIYMSGVWPVVHVLYLLHGTHYTHTEFSSTNGDTTLERDMYM